MKQPYLILREPPRDAAYDAAQEARADRLVGALLAHDVDHVVGVPDNQSRLIYERLASESSVRIVPVCREGEAFAIASGLYAGGAEPALVIQNTGLLEAGDSLRGTARAMGIPLVCLIGYRGYHSLGSETVDSVAVVTEPTLNAWQIPYRIAQAEHETEAVEWAFRLARAELRPVAVLML